MGAEEELKMTEEEIHTLLFKETEDEITKIKKEMVENKQNFKTYVADVKAKFDEDPETFTRFVKSFPENPDRKGLEKIMEITKEKCLIFHVKFDETKKNIATELVREKEMHYWDAELRCLSDKNKEKKE